jgi:putative transcriptional regulator
MHDRLKNSLREERARRNLTQADLAALVGVSRKTINTVENEVFIPSTVLALQLARALKTNVESLFQLPQEETARGYRPRQNDSLTLETGG